MPSIYWTVGGNRPSGHPPEFAPILDPMLRTGTEAMLAAGAWLVPTGAR